MTHDLTTSTPTTLAAASDRLTQLISAWLDGKGKLSNSRRTVETYAAMLTTFRTALLAVGLDLNSAPGPVALVAQRWAGERAGASRRAGPLAPATVKQRLAALSSFYSYACKLGVLDLNPITLLDRPKVEMYSDVQALDQPHVKRALAALDRTTPAGQRDAALLGVALTTGRRLAALAGLRWRDVAISAGKVTLTFHEKGGKTVRKTLAPPIARVLLAWLHCYYGVELGALPPDAPIWVALDRRTKGSALGPQAIDDICRTVLGCHPHQLRHTFAHQMLESGASLPEISAELGHSDLKVTSVYLKQLQSSMNPYADTLAAAFGFEAE